MLYRNRILKHAFIFLLSGTWVFMTACGRNDSKLNIDTEEIFSEIDEYMNSFIGLYTGNAFDDVSAGIAIEEKEILYDNNNAVLVKYIDSSVNKPLRYTVQLYGETMNVIINYYLCENFTLVSRQCNYYSSWMLTVGGSDVLYSTIENWIIVDETIYVLHDNGELEELEGETFDIPLPEEFLTGYEKV